MENQSSLLKSLLDASLILALITSLLYFSGSLYTQAYLEVWGIDSSLIKSNHQDLLMQGAINSIAGGASIIFYLTIVTLIFMFLPALAHAALKIECVKAIIFKDLNSKLDEDLEKPKLVNKLEALSDKLSIFFIFFTIFILLFFYYLKFSNDFGVEIARKNYHEFSLGNISNEGAFKKLKTFTIQGKETSGFILANSDNQIAIYFKATEEKPEEVVVMPMSAIENIRAAKNKNFKPQ